MNDLLAKMEINGGNMQKKLVVLVVGLFVVNGVFASCYTTVLVNCGWNHSNPPHRDPNNLGDGSNMSCTYSGGGNFMVAQGVETGGYDSTTWYAAYCSVQTVCHDWTAHEYHYDDSYSPTGTFATGNSC